jgi:putative transcriptional regulator
MSGSSLLGKRRKRSEPPIAPKAAAKRAPILSRSARKSRPEVLFDDIQENSPEQLAQFKRVPLSKTLRWRLELSQTQFAQRFHIPIGTLRDWEQGRSEPDQTAKVLLHLIANDPDGIARALAKPVRR